MQAYCQTALLSHPTTRRRLADAAAALESGSMLPFMVATPLSSQVVPQPSVLAGAPPGRRPRKHLPLFHALLPARLCSTEAAGGGARAVPGIASNLLAPNGPTPTLPAGEAPAEPVCRAVLTFFHVVGGVLLPTLVSIWCWDSPTPRASPPAASSPAGARKSPLQRLAGASAAAVAAVNRALHYVLCSKRWWWGAWWLLALTWVCSKIAGGLA